MDITRVLAAHGIGTGITPSGTAVAADVITSKTFINASGSLQTGTMPLRTVSNGNGDQSNHHVASAVEGVQGRIYLRPNPLNFSRVAYEGDLWVEADDPDFNPIYFRQDVNMFGLQGSMPVRTADEGAGFNSQPGRIYLTPSAGYRNGSSGRVFSDDGNFVPSNIRNGTSIYGQVGTLVPGTPTARGITNIDGDGVVRVRGLSFMPTFIFARNSSDAATTSHWTNDLGFGSGQMVEGNPGTRQTSAITIVQYGDGFDISVYLIGVGGQQQAYWWARA